LFHTNQPLDLEQQPRYSEITMIKQLTILTLAASVLATTPLGAIAVDRSNATLSTSGTERTLVLPASADQAPVIALGSGIDPETGAVVEGYAIIHYKKANSHKPQHSGGGGGTTCYGYLASGAKWKTVEPWVVNSVNNDGLAGDFVFASLASDIAKWEDAADGTVGNTSGVDVLGGGSSTLDTLVADQSSPDGVNEVYFADVSSSGAIAVTIVWGVFSGPPFGRYLVEWDQIYDDVDYDWSSAGETGKMDFENIATHELGHSVGMSDLYTTSCSEETMYGYGANGETKKQDLNGGDIAGMNKLY